MLKTRVPAGKYADANHVLKCTICGMTYIYYGSAKPIDKCEMCDGKNIKSKKTYGSRGPKVKRNPRIIKRN